MREGLQSVSGGCVAKRRLSAPLSAIHPVSIQAQTCNLVGMFSGSPKKIALGQIILAILLSVVSGMFFMQGLEGALRGNTASWIQLVSSPALLAIAILHGRRVWQAVP